MKNSAKKLIRKMAAEFEKNAVNPEMVYDILHYAVALYSYGKKSELSENVINGYSKGDFSKMELCLDNCSGEYMDCVFDIE